MANHRPVKVGIIGCGAISGAYLKMARNFPILEVALCADLDPDAARAKATEFGIRPVGVVELLADQSIELVLNLTVPQAHAGLALRCTEAGKHTYSEKPLGINRAEGQQVMTAAERQNLRVGCAPDTFMGAGIQTACRLVNDGAIGRPVGFTAFMLGPGHESWHHNPDFYYQPGGGPMLDMGPYYLTALLNLLGPIRRLSGMATVAIPQRIITSKPKQGQTITVRTPDHVVGTIEFISGVTGVIATSFATFFPQYDSAHPITLYGDGGTLKVPDPNQFDKPVLLRKVGDEAFAEMPFTAPTGYGRAVGLADMAYALRTDRPHRASGQQALAVLDAMMGFLDSSATGQAYEPVVPYTRPALIPADGLQ